LLARAGSLKIVINATPVKSRKKLFSQRMGCSVIHFAFPNKKGSVNFSWIYDRMHLGMNLLLFVGFIVMSFFSSNQSPRGVIDPLVQIPHSRDVLPGFSL